MAENEKCDINFSEIPFHALNMSVRQKLSSKLNPEMPFFEQDEYVRDFRGLAELMGYSHTDIMNFQRHQNPCLEIMKAWGNNHNVLEFLDLLEKMKRYDVIDDLMPNIVSDSNIYLKSKWCAPLPIQDSRITTSSDQNILTIHDREGQPATFDAYVCYANSDIKFVKWLAERLETASTGIRLCIKDRDLPYGTMEYDSFVELIQERCHRILIILSPDFLESPECKYQARYAASLASEYHRCRKLIPIVHQPCETPPILRYISKVDFSRDDIQDWIWIKLVASIKMPTNKLFVPPNNNGNELEGCTESKPFIREVSPNSSFQLPALPSVPSNEILLLSSSGSESPSTSGKSLDKVALVDSSGGSKPKSQKKFVQKFQNFFTSSGSSGFHSQSDV